MGKAPRSIRHAVAKSAYGQNKIPERGATAIANRSQTAQRAPTPNQRVRRSSRKENRSFPKRLTSIQRTTEHAAEALSQNGPAACQIQKYETSRTALRTEVHADAEPRTERARSFPRWQYQLC